MYKPKLTDKRDYVLDIARAFSAIFVIFGHVVASYNNSGILVDDKRFQFFHYFTNLFDIQMFIMLSGYFAGLKSNAFNFVAEVKNKIVTFVIPYISFSLLYWIFKMLASNYVNSRLGVSDLLLILIKPISFMWFIYALFWISILYLIVKRFRINKTVVILISFLMFCASYTIPQLQSLARYKLQDYFICDVFRYSIYYFLAVYYGKPAYEYLKTKTSWILIAITGVMTLATAYYSTMYNGIFFLLRFVVAFISSSFFIMLSSKIINNRFLRYLGKRTMSIYLLNGILISFIRIVLQKLGVPINNGIIPLVVCWTGTVMISLLIERISTSIKYTDFVFYPQKYLKIKR